MKHWHKYLLLAWVPILLAFVFLPKTASATYQANNLIDDYIFVNKSTMGATDIQSFLNGKNGGIRNYSENGKSAAQIIYDSAQAYNLNPQVILATMQKEQSLVTDQNPSQAQINCAMGYDSCASHNSFLSQVDAGTWQLRYNSEASSGRAWGGVPASSYRCGNPSSLYSAGLYPGNSVTFTNPGGTPRTFVIANAATASLYCYTPYVGPYSETGYSGSYNFVVSFEAWFGPSTGEGYTLVISDTYTQSGGDLRQWVIQKGKRYYVAPDIKQAWGLPDQPTPMDHSYLGLLPDGPNLDRLMRPTGTLDVYFVDGGKCYKVRSPDMLSAWNFNPAAILNVSVGLGRVPTNSGNLTYSVKAASNDTVFLVDGGSKRRYANTNVLAAWEGGSLTHLVISDTYLQAMGQAADITGTKAIYGGHYFLMNEGRAFVTVDSNVAGAWGIDGSALQLNRDISPEFVPYNMLTRFVRAVLPNDSRLFVVENGVLYYLSPDHAGNLGLTASTPRMAISPEAITPSISPWSWVMVHDSSSKQYVIDGGTKRAFNPDGQVQNSWTANGSVTTPQVTNGFLNLLPNNANIERGIKGSAAPAYVVEGITKRWIRSPSTAALYAPIMQVSDALLNALPTGADIN